MSSLTPQCPMWCAMVDRCGTRLTSWRRSNVSSLTDPTPLCTTRSSRIARSMDSSTGQPLDMFPTLALWLRRPRSMEATTRPLSSRPEHEGHLLAQPRACPRRQPDRPGSDLPEGARHRRTRHRVHDTCRRMHCILHKSPRWTRHNLCDRKRFEGLPH